MKKKTMLNMDNVSPFMLAILACMMVTGPSTAYAKDKTTNKPAKAKPKAKPKKLSTGTKLAIALEKLKLAKNDAKIARLEKRKAEMVLKATQKTLDVKKGELAKANEKLKDMAKLEEEVKRLRRENANLKRNIRGGAAVSSRAKPQPKATKPKVEVKSATLKKGKLTMTVSFSKTKTLGAWWCKADKSGKPLKSGKYKKLNMKVNKSGDSATFRAAKLPPNVHIYIRAKNGSQATVAKKSLSASK